MNEETAYKEKNGRSRQRRRAPRRSPKQQSGNGGKCNGNSNDNRGSQGNQPQQQQQQQHHRQADIETAPLTVTASDLHQQARLDYVNQALSADDKKQKQCEYVEYFKAKEKDLLSRTVFVEHVRNLHKPENCRRLREFLTKQFGLVVECKVTYYKGTQFKQQLEKPAHPPGRVTFAHAADAQAIFRGLELLEAGARGKECYLKCENLGTSFDRIRVTPCQWYPDMLRDELQDFVIHVDCQSLALGHWFRTVDDKLGPSLSTSKKKGAAARDEFLRECTVQPADDQSFFHLLIDLYTRTVEIIYDDPNPRHYSSSSHATQHISFKIKQLEPRMRLMLYRDKDAGVHYLIFGLKHAPKIEKETAYWFNETRRDRICHWYKLPRDCLARCRAYQLKLSRNAVNKLLYHGDNWSKLCQFDMVADESQRSMQTTMLPRLNVRFIDRNVSEIDKALQTCRHIRIALLIRALLDHGKICWYHALHDRTFKSYDETSMDIFEAANHVPHDIALMALENMLDLKDAWTKFPASLFQIHFEDAKSKTPAELPRDHFAVPRLMITPLRVAFAGYEVEMSNRVLRNFSYEQGLTIDSFMRARVTDEDGQPIFGGDLSKDVLRRIAQCLKVGVDLCGWRYNFLGYSTSQLTEASFWMFHETFDWSVGGIWYSLGDFSKCVTASKFAARMGQCFSTTVDGLETNHRLESLATIPDGMIASKVIPDVVSRHKDMSMCHSDGNGLVHRDTMDALLTQLPHRLKHVRDASIVQIRFGGAKGTLTAWTEMDDSRLALHNVLLRQSMVKFEAPYINLEVCKVGSHVWYHLNRNVVFLLRRLGVPEDTLVEMQHSLLDGLDEMLVSRKHALELLPKLTGPDSTQRTLLLHMLQMGLDPDKDPFLLDALSSIRNHHLYCLRKKTRIFVEHGAVLMGGLDITGLLPEGCIFVQLRMDASRRYEESDSYKPLVGPVLVTKHPVMHPGDVRMMLAVDIPELRGHRNSILFSRKGTRPAADMMSGADLDGDEFAVTWDKRLFIGVWNNCREEKGEFIPHKGPRLKMNSYEEASKILQRANQKPMEFDGNYISNYFDDIDKNDLPDEFDGKRNAVVDHFVNHMRRASVGRICALWWDYASAKRDGSGCSQCLRLADLHSIAVDFPKNGKSAVIPSDLKWGNRPRAHWREHKGATFECRSTVGLLYNDAIQHESSSRSVIDKCEARAGRKMNQYGQLMNSANSDQLEEHLNRIYMPMIPASLGLDDCTDEMRCNLLRFASEQSQAFTYQVSKLMNRYSLASEGELMTGCFRKYNKLHKRRQHQFAEDVRRQYQQLRRSYREVSFARSCR